MKPTSKAPAACTSAVEISELLLAAFAFLGARDLGRSGSVSKSWRDLSSDDQTWRDLYDRCQRCAETCDPWVKRLAERPRGRDAMGRAVMVWDEDTESGRKGTIVDFDAALGFQVQYVDGGEPRWELEARTRGRWHCRGKSRFTFLEDGDDTAWYPAQGSSSGGDGGDGSDGGRGSIGGGTEATADNSLADGTCPALARSSSFGGDACWSDAVKAGGGAARWLPRRGHWKREYRQNTRHVPRRCVETLRDHTDEVLDLDFSHDGCHLASCSRDYYIYVYEVLFGPDAVPPPMPPLLRRERCSAATAAGTGADAAAAEAAVGGAAGAGNTVLTNTAAVLRSDADIMDAAVAFKPSLTARSDDEAGEAATKAAAAGPWSFRRIQALRSEPLACICRVMWSPCDRFLLAAVEEPHGQPFGNKSCIELWDPFRGRCLRRYPSTPFDFHCAWMPDGRRLVTSHGVLPVEVPGHGVLGYHQRIGVWERSEQPPQNQWQGLEALVAAAVDAAAAAAAGIPVPAGPAGAAGAAGAAAGAAPAPPAAGGAEAAAGPPPALAGLLAGLPPGADPAGLAAAWQAAAAALAAAAGGVLPPFVDDPMGQQQQQQLQQHPPLVGVDWGGWPGIVGGFGAVGGPPDDEDDGEAAAGPEPAGEGLGAPAAVAANAVAAANVVAAGNAAAAAENAAAVAGNPVEWGGEAAHVVDGFGGGDDEMEDGLEADPAPLLHAEIEVIFHNANFGHFVNVAHDGTWLCFATGDNSYLCHRVCLLQLGDPSRLAGSRRVVARDLPSLETGGAVLSVAISRDDRLLLVNVRRFLDDGYKTFRGMSPLEASLHPSPDVESAVELQVWDVATRKKLFTLGGAHAFTTRDCLFLLFSAQSRADAGESTGGGSSDSVPSGIVGPCGGGNGSGFGGGGSNGGGGGPGSGDGAAGGGGNYVSAGSEEHSVYIWHLRQQRLLAVLKGHNDVVSATSWNPAVPGMLASCSDDLTVRIWAPAVYQGAADRDGSGGDGDAMDDGDGGGSGKVGDRVAGAGGAGGEDEDEAEVATGVEWECAGR